MNRKKRKKTAVLPCDRPLLWRLLLFFSGLLMFPLTVGLLRTLIFSIRVTPGACAAGLPEDAAAFIAGGFVYCTTFVFFRKPTRVYVISHEWTHALFGLLSGARLGRINVSEEQGSIHLSHTNVLTTLAPYFFPLYMILLLCLFGIVSLIFPLVGNGGVYFVPVIGAAWGFHFCFTVNSLFQWQSDIESCGFFFSYSLILLLNILVLNLVLAAVSPMTMNKMWWIGADLLKDTIAWFWDEMYLSA